MEPTRNHHTAHHPGAWTRHPCPESLPTADITIHNQSGRSGWDLLSLPARDQPPGLGVSTRASLVKTGGSWGTCPSSCRRPPLNKSRHWTLALTKTISHIAAHITNGAAPTNDITTTRAPTRTDATMELRDKWALTRRTKPQRTHSPPLKCTPLSPILHHKTDPRHPSRRAHRPPRPTADATDRADSQQLPRPAPLQLITQKYRKSQQSSRILLHPNLLIRFKGSQRILVGLSN